MNAAIFHGDICYAPADVICTSTNPHLQLMIGTGGAVRDVGGWVIQDECNMRIKQERETRNRAYLDQGDVAITSAGSLKHLRVIHCVAIDAFHGSSIDVIQRCTQNALAQATQLPGCSSIAFPVFASGNGQFDFATSLRAMAEQAKSYVADRPHTAVFVIYENWQLETAKRVLHEVFGDVAELQQ